MVVAKAGGDQLTIQAAINFAVTQVPAANNRWLVLVMPGDYIENVTMDQFVDADLKVALKAHLELNYVAPSVLKRIRDAIELRGDRPEAAYYPEGLEG